ncbi:DUF5682 family protein [Parenemella sanctibonifatiensis]|uniref:TraB/GumN family protein n=1 Tax=Parenemella sanctibonifatiensis TaxID=2016505 RepID=A0A255ELE5_9ACTN|nr:DUF5682 family protein [Parenemella sanctibonifatiensis]OYN92314.1 hypothetical protein CGZ91_02060 [Parenemella sanctibonifatiensis]
MAEFFGVRHHSPTAARLVAERIAADPPAAVLVEGPSHYTPELDQLHLGHQLPLMIYSWAPLFPDAPEGSEEWAHRRGCFYPLTDYCPEWTAVQAAYAANVETAFIDLPWLGVVDIARAENRWAEATADADDDPAIAQLLKEFGADDVPALLDELIEIDSHLDHDTYRERARLIGAILRRADEDPETEARERFMAARIREAEQRHPDGTVLVVCGAAHISGLTALLEGDAPLETGTEDWQPPADDDRYGVALTPTSYAALDALDGYNAGQPNPGFYDALYADRAAGRLDTAERLLMQVAASLRDRQQFVAPADLVAVLGTARALAQLRGHPQVWRTDLVEAIGTALAKDDLGDRNPLLRHVRAVLRGDAVGRLAAGTRQPPLVEELRAALTSLDLEPAAAERVIDANLLDPTGLERSRLLHSLLLLDIPIGELTTDLGDDGTERWTIRWSDNFETALVAAARFGGSRTDAVSARLLDRAADITHDLAAAANLMFEAALCGVERLSADLQARTQTLLSTTGDLAHLGAALTTLMQLYRYDPILRATGRTDLGGLVATAYDRAVSLTDRLAPLPEDADLDDLVDAIRATTDTAERVGEDLGLDRARWDRALAGVVADDRQAPGLRGAALGARWLTDAVPDDAIAEAIHLIATPTALGDFVAGLLTIAREAALRRPPPCTNSTPASPPPPPPTSSPRCRACAARSPGTRPATAPRSPTSCSASTPPAPCSPSAATPSDAAAIAGFEQAVVDQVRRFLGVDLTEEAS